MIVLMTDFGNDFYVGQMKAVIKSICPKVEIIDLCHNILPQNVEQAAIIIHSSYKYFPKKSIFVCVVDPGVGSGREILVVRTRNYIFIVPNNGLITKIYEDEKHCEIYEVYNSDFFIHPISKTFHGRDIFSPVAAHILKGVSVTKICRPFDKDKLKLLDGLKPKTIITNGRKIFIGRYIFHDSFGNIITNLAAELLKKSLDKFVLEIKYGKRKFYVLKLKSCYSDVKIGEVLAYVNSFGYIEVGINCGNAYQMFVQKFFDLTRLQFWLYERVYKS